MRSPILAMLWENWRLTRVEAALRLPLGLVAGSAALTLLDTGATVAFWILIVLHGMFAWLSILKLNGGRFSDGYKPGFPFYLVYTRPVPTAAFVGVAMAYDAISCAALYLVSAALLGFAFGKALPLFSVAVWIVAFHLCYTCVQWSTPNRSVQWAGSIAFGWPFFFLLRNRVESPLQVEFSLLENLLMVLIGVVAVGLTVVGVARQRRGDAVASVPRQKETSGGYPNWLINLFRFPCPTSSATRAQVWFELKSSGLPVLSIGLSLAMLILLLFVISIPLAIARPVALGVAIFIAPTLLLTVGVNAFGIHRKQGRTFASTFDVTQPYGTAQLAALKVLVRTACVLAAFIGLGVSVWTSSWLVNAWGSWVIEGKTLEGAPGLTNMRLAVEAAVGGLAGYTHVALAVVTSIAVAGMVALLAAFTALRARYSRRVIIAMSLLLFCGLALILLAIAAREGIAPASLAATLFAATRWTAAAAVVLAIVYLFWNSFAERVLTVRYICSAIVISAAFGAAWLMVMRDANVQLAAVLALPPLMASVLAPWSLDRVRHT